jgi:thiol:disulfide interchange protein/DsbC/DsbD-like thiol-disulfide interchange protein
LVARIKVCLVTPLLALLCALVGAPAQAQTGEPNHIAVRLVAESSAPAPNREVTLAFVMTPEPGWHGYWQNPGDAGVETKVDWRLPYGMTVSPLRYPVPQPLLISGLMNYVYEGPYALLASLHLSSDPAKGTKIPISAHLQYLACTDRICVPEQADVNLDLTVGEGIPEHRAEFDSYRRAQPKPLGSTAVFEASPADVRIAIPLPASLAVSDVYFFPGTRDALQYAAPQGVTRRGDRLIIETRPGVDAAKLGALDGVLRIGPDQGLQIHALPGTVGEAGRPLASAAPQGDSAGLTIIAALFAAILGGLVLNIMPCVFPILSLKALSLARAGGAEREARMEAFAYTAGVILICLALGGVLLALRAGGLAVGWAFQLQDARSILLLLLLVGAITLNLAGLFELPAVDAGSDLTEKGGTHGAFWTGALAAFVATPCTGPFMGAALGAALVLPTAAALAIFAGLGLGLALPFLLLGLVPALRRRLPRPGPWMQRLRHILALPMALTTIALGWVLSRQAGFGGLLLGLAALLILAVCLWLIGRRQHGGKPAWPLVGPAIAAAVAALLLLPLVGAPIATAEGAALGAEPFSEVRLAALQAERRSVFVYFTADWCMTCKVNEKAVLDQAEVARAFRKAGVKVLVGDWTNGDPAMTRFLEKHGRSGVPLYLYYAPGRPVQVLPQLLTPSLVIGLVG